MDRSVGTCSLCGGAVTLPDVWMGTTPPIPACSRCGATPKNPHGPLIDMERPSGSVSIWQNVSTPAPEKGDWK